MRMLFTSGSGRAAFRVKSDEWNNELTSAVEQPTRSDRTQRLKGWRRFPHADDMHPPRGGEHFMPLLVCAGAANDGETAGKYIDDFLGINIYTYYWGAEL